MSEETSNPPPEYSPSLSQVVEFNAARRECRSIIENGRDLAGVDQLKWEYEAKRWANVVRPRLDQVITDRRKSGAPDEHLAMLARERSIIDNEWKLVCEYREIVADQFSPAGVQSKARKAGETGKQPLLVKWLEKRFEGKPVPSPSFEPRKPLISKALAENHGLGGTLDDATMQKAIETYNAGASKNDPK